MAALLGFPEIKEDTGLFENFRRVGFLFDIVIISFLIVSLFLVLILLFVILFISDSSSDSSSASSLLCISVTLKFLRLKDLFFSYSLYLSFQVLKRT